MPTHGEEAPDWGYFLFFVSLAVALIIFRLLGGRVERGYSPAMRGLEFAIILCFFLAANVLFGPY